MKKVTTLLLFVLSFNLNLFSQQQLPTPPDWISQFDGIPIQTSFWWDADGSGWINYPPAMDSMVAAGINVLGMDINTNTVDQQISTLGNKLKVIPSSSMELDWIQHYTNAKYSVWEAEGNDNYEANLEYPDSTVYEENSGDTLKYIKLLPVAANKVDTLIKGPYYIQDVGYYTTQNGMKMHTLPPVLYTIDFRMKLEINPGYSDNVNINTPLCIIQTTQSKPNWNGSILECTHVIDSLVITRGQFDQLNKFDNHSLVEYDLLNPECQPYDPNEPDLGRWEKWYVQYKVIWLGVPNYLLSIDKVTVSDHRGMELKNPASSAESNIIAQLQTLYNHNDKVAGWMGLDEPWSLDTWEPIRMVQEILDASPQKPSMYFQFNVQHNGRFHPWEDPARGSKVNMIDEFMKRVGKANLSFSRE